MKNKLNKSKLILVLFFFLLAVPKTSFSQLLDLGILSTFEAFTGNGAITNSGTFTGDVGTNGGILTGFIGPPSFNNGTAYNSDATTVQGRKDVLKLYILLNNLFVTQPGTHAAVFGGGETINPGVYSIGQAGSVAGALTLDGGGNPDAVFVIKFSGAFSVGAGSTIILSNGTRACNVFWVAEGAIDVATNCVLNGNLLSFPGAISLAPGCTIVGRLISHSGAITIGDRCVATIPDGPMTIPLVCGCSTAAPLVDVLASIENFALFTSRGAVANTSISGVIGDVGSHDGAITGFDTATVIGSFYNVNAVTTQASIDLNNAYVQLTAIPITDTTHAPAFGGGETLNTGVYYIEGAGSLGGTITLDAQGNNNAIFIFRFNGAFAMGAQSKIIMINGACSSNIFWISEGAITVGANSAIKGTLIANLGACNAGGGCVIEGRMLSTDGAVGMSIGVINNKPLCFSGSEDYVLLLIELLSFTAVAKEAHVQLNWATASETSNDYFTVERSTDGINFETIAIVDGAGNSSEILNYSAVDNAALDGIAYYRLKQTDYDGQFDYSNSVAVKFENRNDFIFNIYPNPNNGQKFNLHIPKNNAEVLIAVYDMLGKKIYSKVIITSINGNDVYTINLFRKLNHGVYLITVTSSNKTYNKRLIVK
jgi:hypothetical protein